MHLRAQRGWWDNILANDLKGAEDHLGRCAAKQLWDEMSMGTLREQALLDVDEEHKSNRLSWVQVKRIIEPFPKRGQLDTYIEGMDDEGDPDEMERGALPWNDDAISPESEDEPENTAALAAARPEDAIRRVLSDAQQIFAEEGKERLARLYRIQGGGETFTEPTHPPHDRRHHPPCGSAGQRRGADIQLRRCRRARRLCGRVGTIQAATCQASAGCETNCETICL